MNGTARFTILLAGLACLGLPMVPAYGGAWTLEEGSAQAITTLTYYEADGGASGRDLQTPGSDFKKWELSTYAEYGLTDSLTIGMQPRYQWLVQDGPGAFHGTTDGFSDLDLFIRQRVWRDDSSVFSVQGMVKTPTGYDSGDMPALGNGQVDIEPRILFGSGFSLGTWPSFVDLELAYRFRTQSPADEVRFDATFGFRPLENWQLLLQSLNTIGMRNESSGGANYSVYKAQASVVRDLSDTVSLQLGGYIEYAGRNASLGEAGIVSIWLRF